jgi:DNA excision repair protein ERCC-2
LTSSRIKKKDASKLQDEYVKLVEGLQLADQAREEDAFVANPGQFSRKEPGNIYITHPHSSSSG